ncbi:glycosyltransferase family 2 protein [Patescibacteria group bacterium]|nr:glycosyltransferase family 2 protein [Patescibacteria group bacterium]
MLVSIIIPAYKQGETILKDISRIYQVMSQTRWDFEIILVNDGSPDNTLEEALKFNKPNFYAIGYATNRGKGYAVRYGMARAKGDYVAFIDSGMDIDPNGISLILEHMQWYNADIIVGSKRHPASESNFPWIRRFYSWGYHFLVKLLFRIPLRDTQVGLKVYKREVLEVVLPRLVIKQFAFDIELLAVAKYLGFKRMYEAPVRVHIDVTKSTFKKFLFLDSYIKSMLLDTLAVFYRMYFLRYYHPTSKQKWRYDKELEMRVNTGEL